MALVSLPIERAGRVAFRRGVDQFQAGISSSFLEVIEEWKRDVIREAV